MKHISEIPSTHQEPIVLVDYKPILEAFKKSDEERSLFKKLRHTLKRMNVNNKSQPSSREKKRRSIR